jgi:hypothetical protein
MKRTMESANRFDPSGLLWLLFYGVTIWMAYLFVS